MSSRRHNRDAHWRQEYVQEAARLMADGGIQDYELAKRKARDRLRLPAGFPAPRNQDIEAALIEYRALYGGARHDEDLRNLRRLAADAMSALGDFRPRLVGPVLSGAADGASAVCLHLFADAPEDVALYLIEQRIPFRDTEHRVRMSSGDVARIPGFSFVADGVQVDLLIFAGRARRHTPMSPVDGRPMRRANLAEVRALAEAAPPEWPAE